MEGIGLAASHLPGASRHWLDSLAPIHYRYIVNVLGILESSGICWFGTLDLTQGRRKTLSNISSKF